MERLPITSITLIKQFVYGVWKQSYKRVLTELNANIQATHDELDGFNDKFPELFCHDYETIFIMDILDYRL